MKPLYVTVEWLPADRKLVGSSKENSRKELQFSGVEQENDTILDFLMEIVNLDYPNLFYMYDTSADLILNHYIANDCFHMTFIDDIPEFESSEQLQFVIDFYLTCIAEFLEKLEVEQRKAEFQLSF